MKRFFVGVDGGGSKCVVRIEDEQGKLIAQKVSGPANIRISVDQAWHSIATGIKSILQPLALSLESDDVRLYAGMGLAGCEIKEAYEAFSARPHPFHSLVVSSDAHIACLGAHGGEDGAIIIAGTGVVGFQIQQNQITKVSGFGFPHDDEGGGAWLGLCAVRTTLRWLDKRGSESALARAVYRHFNEDQANFVAWANNANSTAFATLAAIVIDCANKGDNEAICLMQKAALAISDVSNALVKAQIQALPCAMLGGLAAFIQPYLGKEIAARLSPAQCAPEEGAIMLIKKDETWRS